MKNIAIAVLFFPLLAFCVAGVIEVRSNRSVSERFGSLIPIVLGIAAFGLALNPQWFFEVTPGSSVTLSRVMTMISAVIACSGVFVSYSRRSSAIWVACGGLLLSFIWIFNRVLA